MGTKAQLLKHIVPLIQEEPKGIFLDVFSGICSVGRAVQCGRPIWSNDLLKFPALVGRLQFTSREIPPSKAETKSALSDSYNENLKELKSIFAEVLREEYGAIRRESNELALPRLRQLFELQCQNPPQQPTGCADIFTRNYGGIYFGYRQAIEIDSIRRSIERWKEWAPERADWAILALCVAVGKCATTTGHFAQPLSPKLKNLTRFRRQRSRSIYSEMLGALAKLRMVKTTPCRLNRSYNTDAVALLDVLSKKKTRPSIIYADPPYTKDQYSRYYHIYDTLVSYVEPGCVGKGRYPTHRLVSNFSLKTKARQELDKLITLAAQNDATLILSYPSNGLIARSTELIPEEIKTAFGRYPSSVRVAHQHSTLGGSKGSARREVFEHIYKVAA